jgi:acetolactate synthase-1/2/3 large subunit
VPPKVQYRPTDLGSRLVPVIEAIIAWGHSGAHEMSEPLPRRKASPEARDTSCPSVLDVIVTRDPAKMLPGVDNRALKVEKGDRPV